MPDKTLRVYNLVQGSQGLCSTSRAQACRNLQGDDLHGTSDSLGSDFSSALEMSMASSAFLGNGGLNSGMGVMLEELRGGHGSLPSLSQAMVTVRWVKCSK